MYYFEKYDGYSLNDEVAMDYALDQEFRGRLVRRIIYFLDITYAGFTKVSLHLKRKTITVEAGDHCLRNPLLMLFMETKVDAEKLRCAKTIDEQKQLMFEHMENIVDRQGNMVYALAKLLRERGDTEFARGVLDLVSPVSSYYVVERQGHVGQPGYVAKRRYVIIHLKDLCQTARPIYRNIHILHEPGEGAPFKLAKLVYAFGLVFQELFEMEPDAMKTKILTTISNFILAEGDVSRQRSPLFYRAIKKCEE